MKDDQKVIIKKYDPKWIEQYNYVAKIIMEKLGSNIENISHIGSTSIPKMPAKNIIDIQIGVNDFNSIHLFQKELSTIGFNYLDQISQDHVPFKDFDYFEEGYEKRFFKGIYNNISCNIHIRITGSKNWKFALNFRDFLIEDNKVATAYAQIKERISCANLGIKDYCLIKDPICDLIYLLFEKR